MYYTIYRITNIIDNKIYIGAHKTNDLFDDYFGSGKYLINAINKHGIENFHKEIMQIYSSSELMYEMESLLVTENFINRKDTYNLKIGGEGGFDHINSNYLNIYGKNGQIGFGLENLVDVNIIRAKWKSEGRYNEFCNNISTGLKIKYEQDGHHWTGKKHKEETKIKIGKANKIQQQGKLNSQFGTCWIYNINLKQNKKIPKNDLNHWLNNGWLKGRKGNDKQF